MNGSVETVLTVWKTWQEGVLLVAFAPALQQHIICPQTWLQKLE